MQVALDETKCLNVNDPKSKTFNVVSLLHCSYLYSISFGKCRSSYNIVHKSSHKSLTYLVVMLCGEMYKYNG